ncbi:helix-turn-helix domain-containing protein [Streptomyces sp. NPDC002922]|uniref:TetR/AcrR family transcriptional regulator n=1 Tax=Streptomyces sp. NPDC002922 TaxID=3154439 RepID=UPI0033B30A80
MRQPAEGGISAVALTRIAKELELSGSALYRYFANRDDLLGSLIGDAYQDHAAAIEEAAEASAKYNLHHRLLSLAGAHRAWAVQEPHRYLLIAGTPLPGYSAPPQTLTRALTLSAPRRPGRRRARL